MKHNQEIYLQPSYRLYSYTCLGYSASLYGKVVHEAIKCCQQAALYEKKLVRWESMIGNGTGMELHILDQLVQNIHCNALD